MEAQNKSRRSSLDVDADCWEVRVCTKRCHLPSGVGVEIILVRTRPLRQAAASILACHGPAVPALGDLGTIVLWRPRDVPDPHALHRSTLVETGAIAWDECQLGSCAIDCFRDVAYEKQR